MAKEHDCVTNTDEKPAARVVMLQGKYLVLDGNNKPLTDRYSPQSFVYVLDTANTAMKMANVTKTDPGPIVKALATFYRSNK